MSNDCTYSSPSFHSSARPHTAPTQAGPGRSRISLAIAAIALTASCNNVPGPIVYLGGGDYQTSPSGRAVALVDARFYHAIVNAPPLASPSLDAVLTEVAAHLDYRPEATVFVLDYEYDAIAHARLMQERGFLAWSEDLERLTDEELFDYGQADVEVSAILRNRPSPPAAAFNRRYAPVDSGTGALKDRACFGCAEIGRGHVFLPTKEDLVAGRFLHEFAHFWAAHLRGPAAIETQVGHFGGHWGYTSVYGLLGGWNPASFVEVGGGTYRAELYASGLAQNFMPYATLELYLMGLAPPDEVPDVSVAINPKRVAKLAGGLTEFTADRIERVTIEDIIAANGPRLPAYPGAPSTFDILIVVLTDHELTEKEWDFYERAADFLEAEADIDLRDAFPIDDYPAHHDWWDFATGIGMVRYINFNTSTLGRGTMRFRSH